MTFDFRGGELCSNVMYASPGTESHETTFDGESWRMAMRGVRTWIGCMKRELSAPDLWADVVSARDSIAAATTRAEPDLFTASERATAIDAIAEIRARVEGLAGSSGVGFRYMAASLDHLEAAVDRLNKRDWLYAALGVLVTIVIGLAHDQARAAFSTLWETLRRALGGSTE